MSIMENKPTHNCSPEYVIDSYFYDKEAKYMICKVTDGKRKVLFGGLTYTQAYDLLKSPDDIERINMMYTKHVWVILGVVLIGFIIYLFSIILT